jgi:hypothetical protein
MRLDSKHGLEREWLEEAFGLRFWSNDEPSRRDLDYETMKYKNDDGLPRASSEIFSYPLLYVSLPRDSEDAVNLYSLLRSIG